MSHTISLLHQNYTKIFGDSTLCLSRDAPNHHGRTRSSLRPPAWVSCGCSFGALARPMAIKPDNPYIKGVRRLSGFGTVVRSNEPFSSLDHRQNGTILLRNLLFLST